MTLVIARSPAGDEAIQASCILPDCFASLAMTVGTLTLRIGTSGTHCVRAYCTLILIVV